MITKKSESYSYQYTALFCHRLNQQVEWKLTHAMFNVSCYPDGRCKSNQDCL